MAAARRAVGLARGGLGRGARGAAGTDPAGLAGGRGLGARPGGADAGAGVVRVVLFAAAGAGAAWVAWPRPGVGHVAEGRFNAIVPVLLLAVLPLLSLRLFGLAGPSRLARAMRVLYCAAVLALVPAFTFLMVRNMRGADAACLPAHLLWPPGLRRGRARPVQRGSDLAGRDPGPAGDHRIRGRRPVPDLAARRARSCSTLAIAAGTGLLFGVVMFAVDPLGLSNRATNPWLPGSTADPLVVLAWILLFGGPWPVAVALTGWRCRGPDGVRLPYTVRVGQGVAAGVLANGIAAMFTTVLGTGAILLVLRFPSLMHWVNHGRDLTAVATYRYELNTETTRPVMRSC